MSNLIVQFDTPGSFTCKTVVNKMPGVEIWVPSGANATKT